MESAAVFKKFMVAMMRLVLLVLVLGAAALMIFLSTVGLPKPVLDAVCARISNARYSVSIHRLTYHPWNKLVGHDLCLRDANGKQLVLINRVDLLLDVGELLHYRLALDALKLAGATLTIPIRPDLELQLKDVRARISLDSNELNISQFDFRWEKIWFSITGILLNPDKIDFSVAESGSQNEQTIRAIKKVAAVMTDVHYGQKSPSLECVVSGDLANLQSIEVVKLSVNAPRVRWRNLALSDVVCEASYTNRMLRIRSLNARDLKGSFAFTGEYEFASRLGNFSAISTLDPTPFIKSIHFLSKLQDLTFSQSPMLKVEGKLYENAERPINYKLVGRLQCNDFEFRKVALKQFISDFLWENDQFLSRRATLTAPEIDLTVDAHLKSDVLNFRLAGAMKPTTCASWFDEGIRRTLAEMKFVDPLQLKIEGKMQMKKPFRLSGSGTAELGRTSIRGSWIDSGQTLIRFEEGAVAYDKVTIKQGAQTASGDLVYDFKQRELRFLNLRSEWMPYDVLIWVDRRTAESVKPYRFNQPPFITGDGVVDLDGHQERNRIAVEVNAPAGFRYDLFGKTLDIEAAEGTVEIRDNQLLTNVHVTQLYEGHMMLQVDVSLDPNNPVYSVNLRTSHVDFPRLTKMYFNYDIAKGWMDAELSFQAQILHPENLIGKGSIHVQDGNVFAIPFLGPLSVILNEVVPGAGYQTARAATAEFTIRKQIIHTKRFEIEGKGFSVLGEGDIYFMKDRMNMSARINAQGLPGVVFFPVSKLFEYVSEGSMSHPVWRPKRMPSKFFKTATKNQ